MWGEASQCGERWARSSACCDDEKITRGGAAKQIVDIVKMFGLRTIQKAPEKEEITAEDVGVVCWMGVLEE